MEKQIERAKELIKECIKFDILESWDRKIKVIFEPDDKEKEVGWTWMSLEDAAKDLVEQNAFNILEEALEKAKEYFVDGETFRTDTEAYAGLLKQAEEYCRKAFPVLHETVFGEEDYFFLYYNCDFFTLYYYNPDSNAGGQIVECTFDEEMAKRILKGEPLTNVLAEREQYLYDINTKSFFEKLKMLADAQHDRDFFGYVENEEGIKRAIWVNLFL